MFGITMYMTAADAATLTVTNAGDQAFGGTLREALLNAGTPGNDTIAFNLAAPYTIQPTGSLPRVDDITGSLYINGGSQPGYTGVPLVCIDGQNAGPGANGFLLYQVQHTHIHALQIMHFDQCGVLTSNSMSTKITGCYLVSNGTYGIHLSCGNGNNQVGGTNQADGNVISANGMQGLYIEGINSRSNVVQGNRIGTDADGMNAMGNGSGYPYGCGIHVFRAPDTLIGGNTNDGARNIIGGHRYAGIYITDVSTTGTVIQGNSIGATADGLQAVSNRYGIRVEAPWCAIGGAESGQGNLISGNAEGIHAYADSHGLYIQGNTIGLSSDGQTPLGNDYGVKLVLTSNIQVGGRTAGKRNYIAGNDECGLDIIGSRDVTVMGNWVGIGTNKQAGAGHSNAGVMISAGSRDVQVGGTILLGGGNVIGCNDSYGIWAADSTGLVISANHIGVFEDKDLGNTGGGIGITASRNITVGGISADRRNYIGNNSGSGINGQQISNGLIGWNFIGLSQGQEAAGNAGIGVQLSGANSICVSGNVICANMLDGIELTGAQQCEIKANYLGISMDGTLIDGNGYEGIELCAGCRSNTIGGNANTEGNIIVASGNNGIRLINATNTAIRGNRIGCDDEATNAIPNQQDGINITLGSRNVVGGTNTDWRNIISGNSGDGIEVGNGNVVTEVTIHGNYIGCGADRDVMLGNGENGIRLFQSRKNTIGDMHPDAPNVIAYNHDNGISVQTGNENTFIQNEIFDNGLLGIELGLDGMTTNDYQDPDPGANNLQNYPVIQSVSNDGGYLAVAATLNTRPSRFFMVSIFGNTTIDLSGYGEGEINLTNVLVLTDGNGDTSLNISSIPLPNPPPNFISATASSVNSNNTSEFSRSVMLDSDGDGMPDGWETLYFGSATGGDPAADPDSDAVNNLDEYIADTLPNNSNSFPRIEHIAWTNGHVEVTLPASRQRNYELLLTTNLHYRIALWGVAGNGPGTNSVITIEDLAGGGACTFYTTRAIMP
jgi:hypothetical protein